MWVTKEFVAEANPINNDKLQEELLIVGATEDILRNGWIKWESGVVVHLVNKMTVEEHGHHM